MKGSNYTAHINSPSRIHMVYSKHNTLHCSAIKKPFPQGPWAFCPQLMRRKQHKNPNRSLAIHRSKIISSYLYSIFTDVKYSATSPSFHQFTGSGLQMGEKTLWRLCHSPGHCKRYSVHWHKCEVHQKTHQYPSDPMGQHPPNTGNGMTHTGPWGDRR